MAYRNILRPPSLVRPRLLFLPAILAPVAVVLLYRSVSRIMAASRIATLTPQRFHILLALSEQDLHGSAIVRRVLDHTDGELHLWPATLYGNLESLRKDGLIVELGAGERPEGESEKRRYYRLTSEGRRALSSNAERMTRLAEVARRNLGRQESS